MADGDFPLPEELNKPRAEMTAEEKIAHNKFCKDRKKHITAKRNAELGIVPGEPSEPKVREPKYDEEGNLVESKHKPRSEMTPEEKQADNKARKDREKKSKQAKGEEGGFLFGEIGGLGQPAKKKAKKAGGGEPAEFKEQLDAWVEAKRAKDFDTADAIRVELRAQGIEPDEYRPAGGGKGGKGGGNMMNMMGMMGGGGKGKGGGKSAGGGMMEQMMMMMMMNQMGGGKGW